ncbi:MAG TPA: hypothetical protein VIV36_09065 [Gaiella sp.]
MRLVLGLAIATLAATAGTSPAAGPACDAGTARSTLTSYVQAFNGGRYSRLQLLFAQEPEFGWYAVSPPHGRTSRRSQDRSTLMSYFRARHRKREVLRVVLFNFASTQERDGALVAHFNGRLSRAATDLPLERRGFKATIRCGSTPQFVVLSIGTAI